MACGQWRSFSTEQHKYTENFKRKTWLKEKKYSQTNPEKDQTQPLPQTAVGWRCESGKKFLFQIFFCLKVCFLCFNFNSYFTKHQKKIRPSVVCIIICAAIFHFPFCAKLFSEYCSAIFSRSNFRTKCSLSCLLVFSNYVDFKISQSI